MISEKTAPPRAGPASKPAQALAPPDNRTIASLLDEMAIWIDAESEAPSFRARAYRRGAARVRTLDRPVSAILDDEGLGGLIALPDIGAGIARAIQEVCETGRLARLEDIKRHADPHAALRSVPGIGATLAERLARMLGAARLEDLQAAAADGRLAEVPGIGKRRATAIEAYVSDRLRRHRTRTRPDTPRPSAALLLQVDAEYRRRAKAGTLPTIRPNRFNPDGTERLPILHEDRLPWSFTALYSNTAAAHRLGRTRDWVVIYYSIADGPEGQCTVVTETHGPFAGLRVIRGHEAESVAATGEKP